MDEQLNGTTDELAAAQVPEVAKKLSPEEKADLEKKRTQFRKLHDLLAEEDLLATETFLGVLEGAIASSFQALESKVKVEELVITVQNDMMIKAIQILKTLSVQEAVTFTRVLYNKMKGHTMEKTKDWKLKDLEIELL